MIRINYFQNGNTHKLAVSGHAGYSNHGNDIVCAGVSTLTLTLLAFLMSLQGAEVEQTVSSGDVTIECTGEGQVQTAFDMALTGYLHISAQYPQNVEVYFAAQGG